MQSKVGAKLNTGVVRGIPVPNYSNAFKEQSARQKMSISNKGKSRSIQARQNMAEAAKRRPPMSDETRKKLSEAQRNRIRKPHSEDTKRKISQAMQGKSKELSATASN
jgi:hypothetical protein